jgi:hypothetical protein
MSLRSLSITTFTPTATADTVALVDATHLSVQGSSGTERIVINEIQMGGQASVTSPSLLVFARHSTFGLTPSLGTGCKDAVMDASSPSGTARGYNTAATDPQRSATLGLLNLTFNAFGGIVKWFASNVPGKDVAIVGNTASLGEAGLSCFTGGTVGAMGGHIIYEPM